MVMDVRRTSMRLALVTIILAGLLLAAGHVLASSEQGSLRSTGGVPGASVLQEGGIWSSGWVTVPPGQTLVLQHNMGGNPDQYAVDVWERDLDGGQGINHLNFGGTEISGVLLGVAWQRLTDNTVEIFRFPNDIDADQILVRVWVPDNLSWESDWQDIAQGEPLSLDHNVGGDPELYTVGMKFQDTAPGGLGLNSRAAGGLEIGGQRLGAAWQNLTAQSISVVRLQEDQFADRVYVSIYQPEPPTWDSGWQDAPLGQELVLTHNLGGNLMGYVVRTFVKSLQPGGKGLNSWYGGGFEGGGNFFGSSWLKLTTTSIAVFRQPNDDLVHSSDQVRVWIYKPEYAAFLPAVVNNATSVTVP